MSTEKFQYRCVQCAEHATVEADPAGVERWLSGELIQQALPGNTPTEREQLKTHLCGTCVEELFAGLVEEEEV